MSASEIPSVYDAEDWHPLVLNDAEREEIRGHITLKRWDEIRHTARTRETLLTPTN